MFDWVTDTIGWMGYPGVVLLMFLENVFPPIPSELVMPLAGFLTVRGQMSLVWVIVAGTAGSVLGALPLYYLGKVVGEERIRDWADRHGRWLTLSGRDVQKAGDWFEQHGGIVVFFGRLVPGIRSLISIPAGATGMNLALFLAYTVAGTAIWSAALAWLGTVLGRNYSLVEQYLSPVSWVVLGGMVAWWLYRVVTYQGPEGQQRSGTPRRRAGSSGGSS